MRAALREIVESDIYTPEFKIQALISEVATLELLYNVQHEAREQERKHYRELIEMAFGNTDLAGGINPAAARG